MTQLLYVRDVGLIVAGPGLTTRQNAIETVTLHKRRKDRMKGKLEPLVTLQYSRGRSVAGASDPLLVQLGAPLRPQL